MKKNSWKVRVNSLIPKFHKVDHIKHIVFNR